MLTEDKKLTTTTTITEESVETIEGLLPEEEKALRMLHGLSESDDTVLQFGLGANDETAAKLAMMEKHLLTAFGWGELEEFQVGEQHIDAKAKIIDALLDD